MEGVIEALYIVPPNNVVQRCHALHHRQDEQLRQVTQQPAGEFVIQRILKHMTILKKFLRLIAATRILFAKWNHGSDGIKSCPELRLSLGGFSRAD